MSPSPLSSLPETSAVLAAIRARTPARILVGRAGPAYRTATQLELREDHAAALDAVHAELDLESDFGRAFLDRWGIFEVRSQAGNKEDFLMRPDLGRRLSAADQSAIVRHCSAASDLQVLIGDGLSAAAVRVQVPGLLPLVEQGARSLGWTFGRPFVIRHCRVGILNILGDLLHPNVAVLLIGERPGLATAESLSAYMAYRPQLGHTDAQRNLISNIHSRGVDLPAAARRIVALAAKMRRLECSGVMVKEDAQRGLLPAARPPLPPSG